ncbi:AMP-binding protein [Microlunatus soli]|uniref:O-succinylbenzoic acid--CoA ligase n=1 Tax=Microlunatus soli TaxID=630515 RepID=A0A1H1W159_9ACTN|nr:AMP-binding protein [Microlunatus soli]SDS90236.1 O-succinylbenzoic acid--CoA ligase [Microlunatus soli]
MHPEALRLLPPGSDLAVVTEAVAAAMAGGQPIAPLPADPAEASRVRTMLRPDRPVTEPDAAVIVSTSGSTGTPKGVVLSRSAISASAAATHARLGGAGHWLLALPTHYVAGLMVVTRAVAADVGVSDVGSDLSGLARVLAADDIGRSYLSLVPTQLARALDDPDLSAALSRVDAVLLGGAAARPDLLRRAAEADIDVVTTYGMSETCGGCVYDGVPLQGVTISLADPDADGVGRVLLGGPTVFSGYRLQPELTGTTLTSPSTGSGVAVRTNDRGRIVGDRLEVLGRFDDVIISGGLKIDLAAVERAARDWPALVGGELAMIGVPDEEWGSRLVCCAEQVGRPQPGAPADLAALQDFLTGRVARHERPRELIMMARLPRTSSGKIDRQRLLADAIGSATRSEATVR